MNLACALGGAVLGILVLGAAASAQEGGPSREELQNEVERLNGLVKRLEEQVEGTAGLVNLGRTSLATPNASSVNGNRGPSDVYYGVANAFDDGKNWFNNINYTYWLSSGEPDPWIEVRFDVPVTVAEIRVEAGPPFLAQFFMAKGGEELRPSGAEADGGTKAPGSPQDALARDSLKLSPSLHGVSGVRLHFHANGNVQVNEVRIMGYVAPGAEYTEGPPRVPRTKEGALAIAQGFYREWLTKLQTWVAPRIDVLADTYIVTFATYEGLDVLRVTVPKVGPVTKEVLARLVPICDADSSPTSRPSPKPPEVE